MNYRCVFEVYEFFIVLAQGLRAKFKLLQRLVFV